MKSYIHQSKYSTLGLLGGLLVSAAVAKPVMAEGWLFDHYEIKMESVSKESMLEGSFPSAPKTRIETRKDTYNWENGNNKFRTWFNGAYTNYYPSHTCYIKWGQGRDYIYHTNNSPVINGVASEVAFAKQSTRAVFRWDRKNAADNPPDYCWMYEEATIYGEQFTRQWADNPLTYFDGGFGNPPHYYKDIEYTFSNIKHPFGIPYVGVTQTSYSPKLATFQLKDARVTGFKRLPNQDIAIGPERTFNGQINLSPYTGTLDRQSEAHLNFQYDAYPVKLRLLTRRKSDHDPNDLVTDYIFNEGPKNSQSSVLAGGNAEHEHEADVVLEVPGVGNTKMKHIPAMKKVNPEGINKSLLLLPTDGTYNGVLKGGRAPLGIVRSRDKIYEVQVANIAPNNSWGTPALVSHGWGSVEWKMGVNGDKAWSTNFPNIDGEETDTEYKQWIWAKIKDGIKPLKDHTMKFVAERVIVRVLDENTGGTITKIFTTNQSETGANVTKADNIDSLVSQYITLPAAQMVGEGIYKGQLIVKKDPNFVVDNFQLSLEDQGVYKQKS